MEEAFLKLFFGDYIRLARTRDFQMKRIPRFASILCFWSRVICFEE